MSRKGNRGKPSDTNNTLEPNQKFSSTPNKSANTFAPMSKNPRQRSNMKFRTN